MAENALLKSTTRQFVVLMLVFMLIPQAVSARQSLDPLTPDHTLGVQTFLDDQPGPLKNYTDGDDTAAAIIASNSLYYGVSPRLHLALLETVSSVLSDPAPPERALRQPFGTSGPDGFADQVEWASRELRAGLGPYNRPPTLYFTDGTTNTLVLDQAPEGIAVQRFLAIGRSSAEWRALVDRFDQVFQDYFNNELPDGPGMGDWRLDGMSPPPSAPHTSLTLMQPWPMGVPVVHLAYFDHVYPTVDSGPDGNNFVVTYLGRGNVQYSRHDGHDYFFPDQPIGTPILAAAPGIAYARTYRGNGVVILHEGGYETVYWHLDGFAPLFTDLIDKDQGVWVNTGTPLGVSGTSGFVSGTPHLHFEVRRYGKQVDPYGWYGPGPDPCIAYAGCAESSWLWHSSLIGTYDFTPPDASHETQARSYAEPDQNPPTGAFAVNPPDGLLLLERFDGHTVQEVGSGFPIAMGTPAFESGRFDAALRLPGDGGLTYPTSGNLSLDAGSIALWARIPEAYPPNSINRHYLFAASANPSDDAKIYTNTLALRRDHFGPGDTPQWTFWTTPQGGMVDRDDLSAPDNLAPGWHHFAITWNSADGSKALYIDGVEAARTQGVILPEDVGTELQLGRFTYGSRQAGIDLDELAIFGRVLSPDEITALFNATEPQASSVTQLSRQNLFVDINATDPEGGIVAVQLGRNGVFEDPQPYYDAFSWHLPPSEGVYDLAVRYFDRSGNSTTLTQTVTLDLPPRGQASIRASDELRVSVAITATDTHQPIDMQFSQRIDFSDAAWGPLHERVTWVWQGDLPRQFYVRFRDANGNISTPLSVTSNSSVYLPMISSQQ
jgi:murein DD-endopeptidase MepM/ murein hydrolase activator NlpD